MKTESKLLHLKLDVTDALPSVTPVYQCSAFSSESAYFYSRKNNPNVSEFEQALCHLEDAKYAVAYACGMSCIYMVLDLLKPGETLVINNLIYGCSYKLFHRLVEKRNIRVLVLDLTCEDDIQKIPQDTAMVFFETPTNPFLKVIDIQQISAHVKALNPKALVVVDNTWATPLYQKPLKHGADISLHSGTKYLSGHSDVMGGVVLVDNETLYHLLLSDRFYSGTILTPYHAWLMRRSLQTLTLRLTQQMETTKKLLGFLGTISKIKKIYYPTINGTQLVNYGGIIFFEFLDQYADQYEDFKKSLQLFETGTGMACVTSMIAQPYTGSHASMTNEEKADMGISKSLVRLCFGLENVDDLKADLTTAFHRLRECNYV